VTARGSTEPYVVIEVKFKMTAEVAETTEAAMCDYIVQNNYALGMVVSVGEVRLFRNRFSSYRRDSVERIGVYPLRTFDDFGVGEHAPAKRADQLEAAVQDWIEEIPRAALADVPDELRQVLKAEFAPYIRDGAVRAAHQRHRALRASEGPARQ
jgi:hypothetical protein